MDKVIVPMRDKVVVPVWRVVHIHIKTACSQLFEWITGCCHLSSTSPPWSLKTDWVEIPTRYRLGECDTYAAIIAREAVA